MAVIVRENNLSETAFLKPLGTASHCHLRWFTPAAEIDLCSHVTLASAFVVMNFVEPDLEKVSFQTLGGELTAVRRVDLYEMDFPAYELKKVEVIDPIEEAFGHRPTEAYLSRDLLCVFEDEKIVRSMEPD